MLAQRRQDVTNALYEMLTNGLPEVSWSKFFKGFQRGKGLVGSLVSDRIDFEYDSKTQLVATARYTIIIADSENMDTVDTAADIAFELIDNDDLNGTATIGEVKRISYAASPNREDAGAVLIEYEVKYYV